MEGSRAFWSLAWRLATISALVGALAGARLQRPSKDLAVVFLVDRSESISSDQASRAVAFINQALAIKKPEQSAGVVVFGDDAVVEREPTPTLTTLERLLSVPISTNFSNIARALRLSMGLFPSGVQRRIVLLSDGNENLGNSLTEAALAAGRDTPVDVVVLGSGSADEVLVESLSVPERIDRNKPFDVRIAVLTTRSGPATVRLFRNRSMVAQSDVQLSPGKNMFLFPQTEGEGGYNTYEATVEAPSDTVRDNNAAVSYAVVEGEPRVLLIGEPEDTSTLLEALLQQKIPAEARIQLPTAATELENFGAVYLVNVSAETMAPSAMRLLHDWAAELGGGVGMIGGPDTYGLGGWAGTPVEEALPVSMELKDKRNFPSLGMALLIDKSGSMAGGLPNSALTKLEIAVEAGVRAINNLTPRDYVGVIGFDSAAKWDVPWQKVENKPLIADQIRSLRPGGGTDAMPAFEEAIRALGQTQIQHRHVLFLTDGVVQPGDYDSVTRRLQAIGATLTAIGIGTDVDSNFLSQLASKNNGRYYETADPSRVPAIFVKETVLAQRKYLIEEAFTPVLSAANQIVRGLGGMPQLRGYVNVEPKDRAEVILRTQREDPLLAVWRYRAGKGLAWTSDARDRWSAAWISWTGYRQFWEQATRWLLRERRPSTLAPRVVMEDGVGKVMVDASTDQGEFQNFLTLEATVLTPDNEVRKVRLRQTGAGQYEGEFEARGTGSYLASVGGDGVEPATAGASLSYPPEYRTTRANGLLLNQIAAMTGGKVDPTALEVFRPLDKPIESRLELWRILLWAAVVLWLLDIITRRVFLDEEQRAQLAAVVEPVLRWIRPLGGLFRWRSTGDRSASAAATLGALQARRRTTQARITARSADLVETEQISSGAVAERLHHSPPTSSPQASGPKPPPPAPNSSPSAPEVPTDSIEEGDRMSRLLEARRKARIRRGE